MMSLPTNIDTLIETDSPELRRLDKGELAVYLLQKLTPQGSEYFDDPISCYKHIKQRYHDNHQTILSFAKRLKDGNRSDIGTPQESLNKDQTNFCIDALYD
jgi:hypothetical protein